MNDYLDIDDPRVFMVEVRPAGWAGEIPHSKLESALVAQNVPQHLIPNAPTPQKCLERAVKAAAEGPGTLIRPIPGGGWTVVLEVPELLDKEADPTVSVAHHLTLTAKVRQVGNVQQVVCSPAGHGLEASIKERFAYYYDNGMMVCSLDLSQWFSQRVVKAARGVATRSRGGSYYVTPGPNLDLVKAVSKALDEVSTTDERTFMVRDREIKVPTVQKGGRVILKPEAHSDAATGILLDNFIAEVEQELSTVPDEVFDLKPKAKNTVATSLIELQNKVSAFENGIGVSLGHLQETISKLQDKLLKACI